MSETQTSAPLSRKDRFVKLLAWCWQQLYRSQFRAAALSHAYRKHIAAVIVVSAVVVGILLVPSLQTLLESRFSSANSIQDFRSLVLAVGCALVGATAIVASLVLFALQVNVERMPHGLFRKLTEDWKLLGSFALAFVIAIGIAGVSAFTSRETLAYTALLCLGNVCLILGLFLYAYRRALNLINPLHQLRVLAKHSDKHVQDWARRCKRVSPILKEPTADVQGNDEMLGRRTFFTANSHWTGPVKQSLRHAVAFALRYAEQGEHDISDAALRVFCRINRGYVAARQGSFVGNSYFIENPASQDDVITEALEQLRRTSSIAISRRDELLINQTFNALATLVNLYAQMSYIGKYAHKSHAHTAAYYLIQAVESVVPHELPDVLLEGQRKLGSAAQSLLLHDGPDQTIVLLQKLATIACVGTVKEGLRAVIEQGMTQFAGLTFQLLRTDAHDIGPAAEELRKNMAWVAQLLLKVKESPFSHTHKMCLGPYYSSTQSHCLLQHLSSLANTLADAEPDNEQAKVVIKNICQWSRTLYRTEQILLVEAVESRSSFTFDSIHWISGVTQILLVISASPACDAPTRLDLYDHADRLLAVLTFITHDSESIKFGEIYGITGALFESVSAAVSWKMEVANDLERHLLSWTFKAGKHDTGLDILADGLSALAVLSLRGDEGSSDALKHTVGIRLAEKEAAPNEQLRERAAMRLTERIENLTQPYRGSSRIEAAVADSDHARLRPLLTDIADMLVAAPH